MLTRGFLEWQRINQTNYTSLQEVSMLSSPICPSWRTPLTKHVARPPFSSRLRYLHSMTLTLTINLKPNPQCSRPIVNVPAPSGCALLRQILEQLSSDRFPTTGGDYLETIFTHREVFRAFPQGHRECAVSFSDLANYLERREWRADRDSDAEAVAAFRHEAWVIANATAW